MQKILVKCSIMAIRGEVHISYLDKINKNISFLDKTLEKKYQFLEKYLKSKQEISLFNFKEFSTLSKALEKNNAEFLKELEQKIKNKSPQQIKEKNQIISSNKDQENPKEISNIKENLSHFL